MKCSFEESFLQRLHQAEQCLDSGREIRRPHTPRHSPMWPVHSNCISSALTAIEFKSLTGRWSKLVDLVPSRRGGVWPQTNSPAEREGTAREYIQCACSLAEGHLLWTSASWTRPLPSSCDATVIQIVNQQHLKISRRKEILRRFLSLQPLR